MKYITQMGTIWRLSNRRYAKLLRTIAADQSWELTDFGTRVADVEQDVTDLDAEGAQDLLNDLRDDERARAHGC